MTLVGVELFAQLLVALGVVWFLEEHLVASEEKLVQSLVVALVELYQTLVVLGRTSFDSRYD